MKTQTASRLPLRTKLLFSTGDLSTSIPLAILMFFQLYFLTDVAGLRPDYAGWAIGASRLWDAFNDPLFGLLSDRIRTRWGRRRVLLLFGSVPLGLFFMLMWMVPAFNQFWLAVYYAVTFILFDTAFTIVHVGYNSLTPEMTSDYDERSSLNGYRMVFSIFLGVLLEPTTVIIKALEQVVAVGQRAFWEPKTVLVTGAGPIGLLAAAVVSLGGFEVHVLDRVETGLKPELVRALGATYHTGSVSDLGFEPDVIVECTGVGSVIADSVQKIGAGGVLCLTGVGAGGVTTRAVGDMAAAAVLKNNVIVGSVNANKRHWYKANDRLARLDRTWLSRLITRYEKPENFKQALERKPDDI